MTSQRHKNELKYVSDFSSQKHKWEWIMNDITLSNKEDFIWITRVKPLSLLTTVGLQWINQDEPTLFSLGIRVQERFIDNLIGKETAFDLGLWTLRIWWYRKNG